jgi:integrase
LADFQDAFIATQEVRKIPDRLTRELVVQLAESLYGLSHDHRETQLADRVAAGDLWQERGLVFTIKIGTALGASNVRRMFKNVCTAASLGDNWTPRELRTSFVSLLSHRGVSTEEIARLVGHSSTRVTETVYRRELRPVITTGAEVMDQIFDVHGPGV